MPINSKFKAVEDTYLVAEDNLKDVEHRCKVVDHDLIKIEAFFKQTGEHLKPIEDVIHRLSRE